MDHETNKQEEYFCDEESHSSSDYCIFHDKHYLEHDYKNRKNTVIKRLHSKIEEDIKEKKEILCIGYHIPEIEINEKFFVSVYFNWTNFVGKTSFKNSEFHKSVDFSYTKFIGDHVLFMGAKFFGKIVMFEFTEFNSTNLNFSWIEFSVKKKISFIGANFKGVDFSATKFSSPDIYFSRAEFHGYTHFNQTKFLNYERILFNQTKFLKLKQEKEGNVSFFKSSFIGDGLIDFTQCIFEVSLTFSRVNCLNKGLLDFTDTIFFKAVGVGHTIFTGTIYFTDTKF